MFIKVLLSKRKDGSLAMTLGDNTFPELLPGEQISLTLNADFEDSPQKAEEKRLAKIAAKAKAARESLKTPEGAPRANLGESKPEET